MAKIQPIPNRGTESPELLAFRDRQIAKTRAILIEKFPELAERDRNEEPDTASHESPLVAFRNRQIAKTRAILRSRGF